MEGSGDHRPLSLDYWDKRWQNGETIWHKTQGDEELHKYIDTFTAGRTGIKVFFPLCGKAVDMKWLADLGHTVVGVEFSVKPIVEFFQENSLEYTIETSAAGQLPVYRSKDGRISIYQCDLFKFSVAEEGKFDAIWDSGSIGSINKCDRCKYGDLMLSLMSREGPGCRYMIRAFEYNEIYFSGPPGCVPESEIRRLYEEQCDVEKVEVIDWLQTARERFTDKFDYFTLQVYLVKPKVN